MKITVVGGGGTGIASASDMVALGHDVTLFEQEKHGNNLLEIEKAGEIRRIGKGPQGAVKAPKISFDPDESFKNAEIIFMALVAQRHKEMCQLIAPHLQDGQLVCFFSGNCGSVVLKPLLDSKDVLVGETVASYTTTRYMGDAVVSYASPVPAPKPVAAFPAKDSPRFVEKLNVCYSCICYPHTPVKNAFEAALNSPNVTVHLIASVMNIPGIEKSPDFRLYRDGLTPSVVKLIEDVSRERQKIMDAFGYVSDIYDPVGIIRQCFEFEENPNPALADFRLSTGPNSIRHRYIYEDAYACNSLLISMGRLLGVKTPVMDAALALASAVNEFDFYNEGHTLENFGLGGSSVKQINHYLETGEK